MASLTIKIPPGFPKEYMIEGIEVLEDRKLGEGAYGIVKLAKYHGLTVAVKKLLPSFFPAGVAVNQLDDEAHIILESFFNECSKLSRIRHPNVIQLLGVTVDEETRLPAIVMELMYESLSQLLKRASTLPLFIEVNICHDIAKALAYLHGAFQPPMVHRDLSSNNILISKDYRTKVTDLGVSKFESSSFFQRIANTPAPGTLAYMAPEVRHIPADCSPAMDIFAFGVIIVQIRSHKFPNPGPEHEKGRLGFPKTIPEVERRHNHIKLMGRNHPLTNIAMTTLKNNPKSRPNALELCNELQKIQTTNSYEESRLACQIRDGEAERIREQISTLQHDLEQTRGELVLAKNEQERLAGEVTALQQENERLQGQMLPSTTSNGATPVSTSGSNSKGQSISKKFQSPWKRSKKSKKKKQNGSDEEQNSTTTPMSVEEEEEEEEEEGEDEHSEDGFAVITPQTVTDAEREYMKNVLKSTKITWTSHRCMLEGLHGVTLRALLAGSRIYLCGGATATGQPNTYVYSCPTRNVTRWSKIMQPSPQYYYASVIVNRELVLIGGISTSNQTCTRLLSTYDVQEKMWVEVLPPLPTARSSPAAATWGDYVVVVGGINNNGQLLDTVEILHLPSQQWYTAISLPYGLAGSSAVVYRNRLYIMGGSSSHGLTRVVFSVAMDRLLASTSRLNRFTSNATTVWEKHQDCPYTMMSLCLFDGYLLAFGGNEKTVSLSQPAEWVWAFFPDDVGHQWTLIQRMHTARKLCCSVSVSSSVMVVLGGNPYFSVIDVAEVTPPPPQ